MKFSIKKLIATTLAATALAGGSAISGSAANETKNWTARHVNLSGVPSNASVDGFVSMIASGELYSGTVTSMSNITNRSLTLTSTTHTLNPVNYSTDYIVYNNTGTESWHISGQIGNVGYKMVAHTALATTLIVEGNVSR